MKPFPSSAVKYLFQIIYPHKKAFIVSMLLILAMALCNNGFTWLFARFVEAMKQSPSKDTLFYILRIFVLIALIDILIVLLPKHALMYRQKYLYFPVLGDVYHRALGYIFGHSVNYIVNKQTGSLLAKANQISSIQPVFGMLLHQFWYVVCNMITKVVLLMIINVWLGVLFLVLCLLVAAVNYYANKPSERLSKMEKKSESLYSGWLIDAVSNIRLVKQFNGLHYEEHRLAVLLKQFLTLRAKNMIVWFSSYTGVGCFVHVCSLLLLSLSVYLWSRAKIDVGDIVFVLMTINGGFMWLMELCVFYRRFVNTLAGIRSGLEPFVDAHEIKDIPTAKNLTVKKADIEFKNVGFAYPGQKKIFDGFNLRIKGGERVGIVGLSGNGKTTLINLLQRAYDIQSGKILIDGQDIKTVTQQSLHRVMAIIPQETMLFHRTIFDNIAYGSPKITKTKEIHM